MKSIGRTTIATVLALAACAAPASAASTIGAPGVGDPFFPFAGNGGIDVTDYGLTLAYDPATRRLAGSARLSIVATQDLSRFDLDLRGFQLGTVTVDGAPAAVLRDGQELVITPARTIRKGAAFTVVVPYSGQPRPSSTPTARARAGSTPPTAPSSSTSRRAPPAGTRPTTRRATRRPTPCR